MVCNEASFPRCNSRNLCILPIPFTWSMFFLGLQQSKAVIFFLHSIKRSLILMGTTNVYCEVREESVYIIDVLWGNVLAQSVSRRPLIAEAPVQFQFSRREIYGGQSGTWTGFSPNMSVFPCQYRITSSPNSYASTRRCYQKHCHSPPDPPPPQKIKKNEI
jgi:hypothetical protein